MKLKTLALLLSLSAASAAQATTYDIGPIDSVNGGFTTVTVAPGSFTDIFDFSIGSLSSTSIMAIVVPAYHSNVTFSSVTLFDVDTSSFVTATTDNSYFTSGSAEFDLTTRGAYELTVNGSNAGKSNGKILASISVTPVLASVNVDTPASPAPEPETYALMLAGLGLVGYATRHYKLV